ncbi:Methyltransferase domain-containing protein [Hymenobacter daecheongensis DSM 21074]|uniref:Methyltransferase domain-containing protein n=1 Tax=Hymenobacter daecheongensis DSM 21074 TaxID=1121955 RepID=A0A1M6GQ27_9BACT|nr:class I SAM-dependent methyltransferase [Hymenobacter daecheongensis]SHJ11998.1 Methyltransferase domain-containing protein [Hymenobacter daecheongensis DSM 21074]
MNKGFLTNVLRRAGLMHAADRARYALLRFRNRRPNQAFRAANPAVALPPDYLMYESFQLNYRKYYEGGRETAQWVRDHLARHLPLHDQHILDWGCGPARVIRHLPAVVGHGCRYTGTDYNARSIEWCRQHLPGIQFLLNGIDPPLQAAADTFDAVYGISIFTHLSAQGHQRWYDELLRVTRPGGVLLFTTHGAAFRAIMTAAERAAFDADQLVIRSNVDEGHRVFAAFQPTEYLQTLFGRHCEVLEHLPGERQGSAASQDVWLLRKR